VIGVRVAAVILGGTRLLAKTYSAMRRGRGVVKRGSRVFMKTLIDMGVPESHAKAITRAFVEPSKQFLTIRNLLKLASEFGDA